MGDDDWEEFEGEPTAVEAPVFSGVDTAPHNGAEFLAGREAGITVGIQATLAVLIEELKRVGCTPEEVAAIATRVSTGALDRVAA